MRKYLNKFNVLFTILTLVLGTFSFSFESSAAQVQESWREFYVSYAEPSVTDYSGYINVLLQSGSQFEIWTFCWTLHGYTESGLETPLTLNMVVNPNSIEFHGWGRTGSLDGYSLFLYAYNSRGNLVVLKNSLDNGGYTFNTSWTIVGAKNGGNYYLQKNYSQTQLFSVHYSEDGSAVLLRDIVELLQYDMESDDYIRETVYGILNSVDGLENQLVAVTNYLKSVDDKLKNIKDELDDIYDKLDELLDEEKEQTSWLGKIWESIQEFLNPSDSDKENSGSLKENSQSQSNQLNELNKENQTEKLDPQQASGSVDANIDTNAITNYGTVLQVLTNHDYILRCLLLTVSVGLVAYVLFGKKK